MATIQADLSKLRALCEDDKTENALLRSRIDEQSKLIMILKQQMDESIRRTKTLESMNDQLTATRWVLSQSMSFPPFSKPWPSFSIHQELCSCFLCFCVIPPLSLLFPGVMPKTDLKGRGRTAACLTRGSLSWLRITKNWSNSRTNIKDKTSTYELKTPGWKKKIGGCFPRSSRKRISASRNSRRSLAEKQSAARFLNRKTSGFCCFVSNFFMNEVQALKSHPNPRQGLHWFICSLGPSIVHLTLVLIQWAEAEQVRIMTRLQDPLSLFVQSHPARIDYGYLGGSARSLVSSDVVHNCQRQNRGAKQRRKI